MKKVFFLLLFICGITFASLNIDWNPPEVSEKPFFIFSSNIVVDGNITKEEWSKTVCFPLRSKFHILREVRKWNGYIDAGMEFYSAWDEKGLYFAAIVSDNEVINDKPVQQAYEQDCIEIFVDGRVKNFMKAPYSKGCYQIFVIPPVNGKEPVAEVFGSNRIDNLLVAGNKTKYGYNIEIFIPWSNFPEIKKPLPGTNIAIQMMLDDYDKNDKESIQPVSFSFFRKKNLFRSPQNFIKCVLAEKNEFQPAVSIECLSHIVGNSIPVAIEIPSMYGKIDSVKISVETETGKIFKSKKIKEIKYSQPWHNALRFETVFNLDTVKDELSVVSATITMNGKTYTTKKPVIYLGYITGEIINKIRQANLKKLSESDPFKALAYLGVGSSYEKIKRAIETDDGEKLKFAVRESAARIEVLEGKQVKSMDELLNLLNLTKNSDSQSIVEYPSTDTAGITFYWGSIPLVTVNVKKFPDQETAKQAARAKITGFIDLLEDKNPAGPVVIGGLPARASSYAYSMHYFYIKNFDPEKYLCVVVPGTRSIYVIENGKIDYVDVEAIVISDDAGKKTKEIVEQYVSSLKKKLEILPVEQAMKKNSFLLVAGQNIPESLSNFKSYRVKIVKHSIIRIPYKNMLISVSHPSRWVAEEAAKLVIKNVPVSVEDIDRIRKTLVNDFAFSLKSSEKVKSQGFIYCGDLHAHSTSSDGNLSPVGMVLESMYCFMDFFALTDHNTIDGAMKVSKILSEYGFDYTFLVGEEITTKNFHFNAYPLEKVIPWDLPAEQIIQLAHQQQAIIQWNHPGWTNSEWEMSRIDSPLTDTGLDAWEHIPFHYYDWKKQDISPALIGSTDTHDGTFSKPERTIIYSNKISAKDIVDAIKEKRCLIFSPSAESDVMYGETNIIGEAWDILVEGQQLKKQKQETIKKMLKNADLPGILLHSGSTGRTDGKN